MNKMLINCGCPVYRSVHIQEEEIKLKIRKDQLLKDIKKSFLRTKNYAKQITLANYYNTIESIDDTFESLDEIDFEWYYNRLNELKVL